MDIFKTLYGYFTHDTNLYLTQIVMPQIKEAVKEFNLEVYDFDSYSITLISNASFESGILPSIKVEIELQEDRQYMVRINNGKITSDIPLGLLNDFIICEIKID